MVRDNEKEILDRLKVTIDGQDKESNHRRREAMSSVQAKVVSIQDRCIFPHLGVGVGGGRVTKL